MSITRFDADWHRSINRNRRIESAYMALFVIGWLGFVACAAIAVQEHVVVWIARLPL